MCNGFQFRRECLKIKAFYIHFPAAENPSSLLNDFLTLRFLPRMIHDPLEIDGSLIQSGCSRTAGGPAFLTLHKLLSSVPAVPAAVPAAATHVYGCRDLVKASEGVRFQVYNGDAKVLKGAIRKDEQGSWKLDCKRGELDIIDDDLYGKEAYLEVAIDVDGQMEFLNDRVKKMRRRRIMNRRNYPLTRKGALSGLEEIPEDLEIESDSGSSSSSCCCCDCDSSRGSTKQEEEEMEKELENVSSWAVDAAILVVSLGVGYLVSRASTKKLVSPWR